MCMNNRNLYRTSRSSNSHATTVYCYCCFCLSRTLIARLNSIEREILRVSAHAHRNTHTHTHRFIISILRTLVNVVVGFLLLLIHVHVHCCCFLFRRSLLSLFTLLRLRKNLNENCHNARLLANTNKRRSKQTNHMIDVYCHEIICYFVISDLSVFFFSFTIYRKLTISNVIQSWMFFSPSKNKNHLKLYFIS